MGEAAGITARGQSQRGALAGTQVSTGTETQEGSGLHKIGVSPTNTGRNLEKREGPTLQGHSET